MDVMLNAIAIVAGCSIGAVLGLKAWKFVRVNVQGWRHYD